MSSKLEETKVGREEWNVKREGTSSKEKGESILIETKVLKGKTDSWKITCLEMKTEWEFKCAFGFGWKL